MNERTLFDHFEAAPGERKVGRWLLQTGLSMDRDKQAEHHARAQRPDFPFVNMRIGESFDVRPTDIGADDLLRCANIVSSAASSHKKRQAQAGHAVDFKTAQIGGRFVRCKRTL
jgi:hypothetical protein